VFSPDGRQLAFVASGAWQAATYVLPSNLSDPIDPASSEGQGYRVDRSDAVEGLLAWFP